MHKELSGVWIMAYTTIDDPSKYFQIATWTGSASTDTITFGGNSDLQLDLLWSKSRSNSHSHALMDTSRVTSGDYLPLFADTDDEEQAAYDSELQSITSDGFTVGTQPHAGADGKTYVGYGWKANGGTRTTNTESGDNPAGGYQANTTAGFSIVDYVGTGAAGTKTHGLGAVPHVMIVKNRATANQDWIVYHHKNTAAPETDYLYLNDTAATADTDGFWNDTAPTSSVFTLKDNTRVNDDGVNIIAYLFTEIQGYSKFGSYTGNGNADGPFVYLGFKPAWLMVKNTTSSRHWQIMDNKRSTSNVIDDYLQANADGTEATGSSQHKFDFLSNGFKLRGTADNVNDDGDTHIFMAFAEQPFVSSKGVPCTAR